MKTVLTKLAAIATKLDERGYKEQADKVDAIMMALSSEMIALADAPFLGSESLSPQELAEMKGNTQVAIPPSVKGKVVIKSKTADPIAYGFFGADQVEKAVQAGQVDALEATNAMKEYLKLYGSTMEYNTLQQLLVSASANGFLPMRGPKAPEEYGKKSFWQRLTGK